MDLDDFGPLGGEKLQCGIHGVEHFLCHTGTEIEASLHTEPHPANAAIDALSEVRYLSVEALRVRRVVTGHRTEQDGAVLDGSCHRADVVEGRAHRDHSAPTDPAGRRLQSDHPV